MIEEVLDGSVRFLGFFKRNVISSRNRFSANARELVVRLDESVPHIEGDVLVAEKIFDCNCHGNASLSIADTYCQRFNEVILLYRQIDVNDWQ
ncbi:hypothetical protein D3C80_1995040 [compost metagenome]